jgi:hypothetical protein
VLHYEVARVFFASVGVPSVTADRGNGIIGFFSNNPVVKSSLISKVVLINSSAKELFYLCFYQGLSLWSSGQSS